MFLVFIHHRNLPEILQQLAFVHQYSRVWFHGCGFGCNRLRFVFHELWKSHLLCGRLWFRALWLSLDDKITSAPCVTSQLPPLPSLLLWRHGPRMQPEGRGAADAPAFPPHLGSLWTRVGGAGGGGGGGSPALSLPEMMAVRGLMGGMGGLMGGMGAANPSLGLLHGFPPPFQLTAELGTRARKTLQVSGPLNASTVSMWLRTWQPSSTIWTPTTPSGPSSVSTAPAPSLVLESSTPTTSLANAPTGRPNQSALDYCLLGSSIERWSYTRSMITR